MGADILEAAPLALSYDDNAYCLRLKLPRQAWKAHSLHLKTLGGRGSLDDGQLSVSFPAVVELIEPLKRRLRGLYVDASIAEMERALGRETVLRERARNREVDESWFRDGIPRQSPYIHQTSGVSWLGASRGACLTDDMGLGKTWQAINAACLVIAKEQAKRVVVICPNTVKDLVWRRQIAEHGWTTRTSKALVPQSSTKARAHKISEWAEHKWKDRAWLVLNYEALRYFPRAFHEAVAGAVLICDEAHRLKNGRAKVSQIIAEAQPERTWLMTGTPVANRIEDLWHLSHLIRPGLLYWSFSQFALRHIERETRFNAIIGYKDVHVVQRRWAMISVGRRKEDCADLPEKIFEVRRVELSGPEKSAYRQMRDTLRAELQAAEAEVSDDPKRAVAIATHYATRMLRLRQIADGLIAEEGNKLLTWSKSLTKLKEALEVWRDAGKPRTVIWSAFVPVTVRMAALAAKEDIFATELWGGVKLEHRLAAVDKWSASESGILSCQMNAMGEGWNGQAGTLEIFLDVPWTPKERLQCIDRLHRIGQNASVTVVDLIAKGTVDGPLSTRLDKKVHEAAHATVGAYSSTPSLQDIRGYLETEEKL